MSQPAGPADGEACIPPEQSPPRGRWSGASKDRPHHAHPCRQVRKPRELPCALGGTRKQKALQLCKSRFLILRKSLRGHHLGSVPFYFPSIYFLLYVQTLPVCLHSDALKQLVEIFLCAQKRLVLTKYSHFYSLLPCCKQFLIREADGVRFQMLDAGGRQRGGASKLDTRSSKSWEINGFMLCVRNDQPKFTSKNSHTAGLWECPKESKCSLEHVPSCHFSHAVRLRPDVRVC